MLVVQLPCFKGGVCIVHDQVRVLKLVYGVGFSSQLAKGFLCIRHWYRLLLNLSKQRPELRLLLLNRHDLNLNILMVRTLVTALTLRVDFGLI